MGNGTMGASATAGRLVKTDTSATTVSSSKSFGALTNKGALSVIRDNDKMDMTSGWISSTGVAVPLFGGLSNYKTPSQDLINTFKKHNDKIAADKETARLAKQKEEQAALQQPARQLSDEVPQVYNTSYSGSIAQWLSTLRNCESGGNYQTNTGNGYYGAYQFSSSTWASLNTGYARADLAPSAVQDAAIIQNTLRTSGLSTQNPGCYIKYGLSNYPPGQ